MSSAQRPHICGISPALFAAANAAHVLPHSTQSEVVVPLVCPRSQQLLAVLDVDSNQPAAFDEVDVQQLEALCGWLASKYSSS
jgi:putative methionine-R-sulfoxide reductase with GAF domain